MIFFIDVKLLISELMIDYVVPYAMLEIFVQLVVFADLISVLDVMLELFLVLANSGERVSNLAHDIADENDSCVNKVLPNSCTTTMRTISGTLRGRISP